jgi:hypothetical protein
LFLFLRLEETQQLRLLLPLSLIGRLYHLLGQEVLLGLWKDWHQFHLREKVRAIRD